MPTCSMMNASSTAQRPRTQPIQSRGRSGVVYLPDALAGGALARDALARCVGKHCKGRVGKGRARTGLNVRGAKSARG